MTINIFVCVLFPFNCHPLFTVYSQHLLKGRSVPSSLQEYDLAIDNIMTFCEEPVISLENLKDLLCAYLMLINVSLDASIFLCSYSTYQFAIPGPTVCSVFLPNQIYPIPVHHYCFKDYWSASEPITS